MYRLTLYYLILLLAVAGIYSIFGKFSFTPTQLIFSISVLLATCLTVNKIFEKFFKAQTNFESAYITALILALIITPIKEINIASLQFLVLVSILAMGSKYILNIKRKHIFNPAGIAVLITGFVLSKYASWWVGTSVMLPFSLLGVLIVRKIRRFDLVFYFILANVITQLILSFSRGNTNVLGILENLFMDSSILFFAFVMLTEPLTTPPTNTLQSIYGGLVGILFAPIHVGFFYTTPEIALSIGNIFSYLISPKQKLFLTLKKKIELAPYIYDFVFESSEKLKFTAGQYLEWTFGHKNTDDRGNRRYFTIASSPTESEIRIGVKFNEKGSSYKREMLEMKLGDKIVAGQLAGDFTLKKDTKEKIVFIAGGIGITPFRSIVKYLIDTGEKRDIILIYCEKSSKEMIYKDIFEKAVKKMKINLVYYETDKKGHIDSKTIQEKIPDLKERTFYLSGPHGMVTSFEEMLANFKLPKKQIKVDYFPGF